MIEFTPFSPVFLTIGELKFHYYGLMYALSFLIIYFSLPFVFRWRDIILNKKAYEELFFKTALSGLLGGRLFYILFYNLAYYLENPLKILAVWEGGMASHGGFIGALLGGFWVCRQYQLKFLKIADAVVILLGIGLALGRLGNFINGELYGAITTVSWCVNFETIEGCRHPTQIYAMLKDFSLFILMFSLVKTKWREGSLVLVFFFCYSFLRFFVESFREPYFEIGVFSLTLFPGQVFSLVVMFFCLVMGGVWIFKDGFKN